MLITEKIEKINKNIKKIFKGLRQFFLKFNYPQAISKKLSKKIEKIKKNSGFFSKFKAIFSQI